MEPKNISKYKFCIKCKCGAVILHAPEPIAPEVRERMIGQPCFRCHEPLEYMLNVPIGKKRLGRV